MNRFQNLKNFKKISWESIQDYGLYSMQLLDYLDEHLLSFFPSTLSLSQSMINNYVKKEILPKPVNKRYGREHIGMLIVIVVLKEVIPLEGIKEGMELQLDIMGIERAYNEFSEILEKTLKNILGAIEKGNGLGSDALETNWENIALAIAVKAFCYQTVTKEILKSKGIYNRENINE